MIHFLILQRIRVDSIKRSWWQILLTIFALISSCFHCMFSESFAHFWKAGCVTKSTFCDLSQLVADPSAGVPGLRKNHLTGTEPLTRLTRWGRGEQGAADTARRDGQEPGIKLGRLIRGGSITAGPEQSVHCLQQTPLHSALCRPHTHFASLFFTILSCGSFYCEGWHWNWLVKNRQKQRRKTW